MTTAVESTNKSLPVPSPSGGPIQPSEPGALRPSTLTELGCSLQTVHALCAILTGLMRETPSRDQFSLAVRRGKTIAMGRGDVSADEWERVEGAVREHYEHERKRNVMHSMF